MRGTTPHIGAEPSVGPKTVVVGFPRVVVECLLALTERARGGAAAVEGINFVQVGEAKASEAPRALHANGPPDAGLECLLGLGKAVGTHETPFARGRTDRTARYQHVHVVIHLAESANSQAKNGAILEQQFLDRALFAGRCAAPFSICHSGFPDVLRLDGLRASVGRVTGRPETLFTLVSGARPRRTCKAHRKGCIEEIQFWIVPG